MEFKKSPAVSVVMTAYNSEAYIDEALQSILNQDCPGLEVIVIDDGSKDGTYERLCSYGNRIKSIKQEHSGIASGWNKGIREAGGDFLSFLDADDLWTENKVKKQLEVFSRRSSTDLCFGHAVQFRCGSVDDKEKPEGRVYTEKQPGISAGTLMIKRTAFLRVGYFREKWNKGIFMDWYMRAKEEGFTEYMHPDVFLKRRLHDTNHGVVQRNMYKDYVRMLKESLDRKRQNPDV